jgi:hypothetical protein
MVLSTQSQGGLPKEFGVLLIPFALAPLILSVLLGKNLGIYGAIFVSLWSSILFRGVDAFLLVMSLISGFISVFVTIQVPAQPFVGGDLCRTWRPWILAVSFGIITIPWLRLNDMDRACSSNSLPPPS